MESMIELFFKVIPTKLFFIFGVFFLWYKLQKNSPREYKPVYRFSILLAVISLALALASITKLYPYGALADIIIILLTSTIAISIASFFKSAPLRFISVFIPLSLVSIFPLFYILHYSMVGGALNTDSLVAIFQTNISEASEYVKSFTSLMNILIILTSISVVSWLAYKLSHIKNGHPNIQGLKASALLLVILLIIPTSKGLFYFPAITFSTYQEEVSTVKQNFDNKQNSKAVNQFSAIKEGNGETYIVIVGESLNKHYMGVYDSEKETTPNLSKMANDDELIVFPNAYSNYPGTMAALSWALSASNQHNKRNFIDSIGLVDVYNEAGFKTVWIGNQPISNSYDMLLGFIAKAADDITITFDTEFHVMSAKNQKPDGILLPHIKKALENKGDENTVIFVHLMGSHTHYCERYPEEYNKFTMPFLEETWMRVIKGGLGHSEPCYKNSILYNDFVVSSIINQLKSVSDSSPAGLLYFADHSEDIVRGVGHSSANFSYDMVESPTLMWLSDSYKEQYPEKVNALRNNHNELYSNDSIFDTAIGMSNINLEAEHYCERCDATNALYELKPDDAHTMHGKLKYVTKENPWAKHLLGSSKQQVSTK